jgi:predicted nucleotidyltransferase
MVLTPLESTLRAVSSDLSDCGVAFALVGGLAVSVRTEPRFTRDADLAVALADDAEAEDLINRLRGRGYSIAAVLEQAAVGRLATVRLERAGSGKAPVVDLLFASSGIEAEIVSAAEMIEILSGFSIRVARTGHLIALKLLSRNDVDRPQDIADLRALLRFAAPEELALAHDSAALIMQRGFNRGRLLPADLAALLGS